MEPALPSLLSSACTTGWFDYVWGELWLVPDGFARLSLGWRDSLRAADEQVGRGRLGPTVARGPASHAISTEDLKQRVGRKARDRWVPFAEIASARLRRGILNSRLQVKLTDGTRIKLLWLKRDPGYDVLTGLLAERLGPRLKLR